MNAYVGTAISYNLRMGLSLQEVDGPFAGSVRIGAISRHEL